MSRPDGEPPAGVAVEPLLEESVEDLYEHAPCGYLSTLVDGTIVKVNETLLAWTGYAREDLVDRVRIHELLAPGDRIFYETHYAPLLQLQGQVREIAVELVRADGSRLPALINSVLRRDAEGAAGVIRSTVFDATDRRGYERELLRARREAEERARAAAALAHVSDGVVVVDPEGRIALANTAAESILGLADEWTGRPVAEAVRGWDELAPRIPVGTRGSAPAPATLPLRTAHGEQWLSVVGIDSGEGVVYTVRDVTADRRLESMRDELIGIVSHELRTPLTGVYGAAQTLRAARDLPREQHDALLALIAEQSERLGRIIDEILLTRRLDTGDLELAAGWFDAGRLAASTAAGVTEARGGADRVAVDAPERVVAAGDREYARQALAHLIENALRYAPDGPIRIGVAAERGRARITVADEGPGVPPTQRERIFERFHRLDPNVSGGVGLGLYIARELAVRMEGRVGLEPTGAGAAFFLELPLAPAR